MSSREHTAPAACTIISRNYLSHARILAESYLRHHPDGRFYLLVVDRLPEGTDPGAGVTLIDPGELRLSYFYEMCFKYDVTELSTAVKPTLLALLMDSYGEEIVIYFDPDILIFRPLNELLTALESSDIVLLPHVLEPIPLDGKRPNEKDILIAGAYNLGFVALRRSPSTAALLTWWEERLRDDCRVSPAEGLMTDQRWIDLVPSLFPSAQILRDPTYDVAYWNIHNRPLTRNGQTYLAADQPLGFFHFSGFDPGQPDRFSKHQDRTSLTSNPILRDLLNAYIDLHLLHGHETSSRWEYGYSRFSNGIRVHPIFRRLYLGLGEDVRQQFSDPFIAMDTNSFLGWATESRDGEPSPFLAMLRRMRYDVADAFPDVNDRHREAFLEWARTQGALEMGYEPQLVRWEEGSHKGMAELFQGEHQEYAVSKTLNGSAQRTARAQAVPGVNVCGYLKNESGLGAAARGYVRALRAADIPLSLVDVDHLSVNRSEDTTLSGFADRGEHDVNLVCVNADEHFRVMDHLGEDSFRSRYSIGVWAWELPHFPEAWHDRFAWYDEVWVGSSFIASALAPVSPIPVVVVPPALTIGDTGSRERGRARIGIPTSEFLFSFIFDFHSYYERKNPLGVIEAFKAAFSKSGTARLVLKCVNEHVASAQLAELRAAAEGYPISIFCGYWRSEHVRDLMAASDAYVSLHRAEGTGLTISDAMALEKPVIVTDWSGNTDFTNIGNSFPVRYDLVQLERDVGPYAAGQTWAEPSIDHAAEQMRLVVDNPDEAARRARRARLDIETHFSEARIGTLIRSRVSAIPARGSTARVERPLDSRTAGGTTTTNGYKDCIERVRAAVATVAPDDATVAVISRGDEELLKLGGRRGWHFPQNEDGVYAGYYPSQSAGAIAHVERLRQKGAEFLVIPATSLWWLDHYRDLRRHLERQYDCVFSHEATGIVYALATEGMNSRRGTNRQRWRMWKGQVRRKPQKPQIDENLRIDQLEQRVAALRHLGRPATAEAQSTLAAEIEERVLRRFAADRAAAIDSVATDLDRLREQVSRETDRLAAELAAAKSSLEERLTALKAAVESAPDTGDGAAARSVALEERIEVLASTTGHLAQQATAFDERLRATTESDRNLHVSFEQHQAEIARSARSVEGRVRSIGDESHRLAKTLLTKADIDDMRVVDRRLRRRNASNLLRVRRLESVLDEFRRAGELQDTERRLLELHERLNEISRSTEGVSRERLDDLHGKVAELKDEAERTPGREAFEQLSQRLVRLRSEATARLGSVEAALGRQRGKLHDLADRRFNEIELRLRELNTSTEARLEALEHEVRGQSEHAPTAAADDRLERVEEELLRIARRFSQRPYMAHDAYGSLADDLGQPMGYSLDAADSQGPAAPRQFIDLFRGSEQFITERQRPYVAFFATRPETVDLGCGRGEFLRLLAEEGIRATGVDLDESHVARLVEHGYVAVQADALDHLQSRDPSSLDGIFTAQMIEHLSHEQLLALLSLAASRLREGGLLVAETVNPENFEALKSFWVDPTHRSPIFPQVLLNLCESAGFRSARIFYPLGGGFTQTDYETAGEYAVVAVR